MLINRDGHEVVLDPLGMIDVVEDTETRAQFWCRVSVRPITSTATADLIVPTGTVKARTVERREPGTVRSFTTGARPKITP